MAVSTFVESIVANPEPERSLTVVPISTQTERTRKRLGLFNGMVEAGAELIALTTQGVGSLIASRAPDAEADAHVATIRRQARLGAEESSAIHGCPCWRRFARIDEHGAAYVVADNREDGLVVQAYGIFLRIVQIVRGLNVSLERELTRRRTTGGRP